MKYLKRLNEDLLTDDEKEELKNISIDLTDLGFSFRIDTTCDKNIRSELRANELIFHKKVHINRFGDGHSFNAKYKFVNIDKASELISDHSNLTTEVCAILPEVLNRLDQIGFGVVNFRYGMSNNEFSSSDTTIYYIIIKIKKEYIH